MTISSIALIPTHGLPVFLTATAIEKLNNRGLLSEPHVLTLATEYDWFKLMFWKGEDLKIGYPYMRTHTWYSYVRKI